MQEGSSSRLRTLLANLAPHSLSASTHEQLLQLALALRIDSQADQGWPDWSSGLLQGIRSWQQIQPLLVQWLFNQGQGKESAPPQSPWQLWAQQPIGALARALFQQLATDEAIAPWVTRHANMPVSDWVEVLVLLYRIQERLLAWVDGQSEEAPVGAGCPRSLYLGFASTWLQLAHGWEQAADLSPRDRRQLAQSARQLGLEALCFLVHHPHFPLYPGRFLLFSRQQFQQALQYFDQPWHVLKDSPTQARLLTLIAAYIGMSGNLSKAAQMHSIAHNLAELASDRPCMVANLNHRSRIHSWCHEWEPAIASGERALQVARQIGDRRGEVNALANLGFAQVAQAQALELPLAHAHTAIEQLKTGLRQAKQLKDRRSQGLSAVGLAMAQVTVGQAELALPWIRSALAIAIECDDVYPKAHNFSLLAETCYQLNHSSDAIYAAAIAMSLFHRLQARDWRQAAGLLRILRGQLGPRFANLLHQERQAIVTHLGTEGFVQIVPLLDRYCSEG
jgi:tetratricopeptide (TPR) repeat protein